MKAKQWLKQKGIHPTEPIYWDTGEKNIYLDELMDEFVSSQLELLVMPNEVVAGGIKIKTLDDVVILIERNIFKYDLLPASQYQHGWNAALITIAELIKNRKESQREA